MTDLTTNAQRLTRQALALRLDLPLTHVYQPLDYAWEPHGLCLQRSGAAPREVLLLGMIPGRFGMAQTGTSFGDVGSGRNLMGILAAVRRPENERSKRPVLGSGCPRGEVSGRRLWGWARRRLGELRCYFERFFVWNCCPWSFMEATGRNRTPDKLPVAERSALFEVCDRAPADAVGHLRPRQVVGIGRFAADRAVVGPGQSRAIAGGAPDPSPANPAANQGWEPVFEAALREIGIDSF